MSKFYSLLFCILSSMLFFVLQPTLLSAASPLDYNSSDPCAPAVVESQADPFMRRANAMASLNEFAATLAHGDSNAVTGVYVCQAFALGVVQQPANDPAYVAEMDAAVTQYHLAANYGTIGLLAHNYLSGSKFFDLKIGQVVEIIYGNGLHQRYMISDIRHLQALDPNNPYSDFDDLDHSGSRLSSTQVFAQTYEAGNQVVFQTCISQSGNPSWGRLFVTALPVSRN